VRAAGQHDQLPGRSKAIRFATFRPVTIAAPPRVADFDSTAFWKPRQAERSLFGAVGELHQKLQDHRLLASRGVLRSFSFRYKNFTYERDHFNVLRGFRLHEFMDGRFDIGLYKHHLSRGVMFGPAGAYLPSNSNRFELMLRWNIGEK